MLINDKLANLTVATEFGTIVFNEKGENNDLKPEEQKKLGSLPGFTYVEDKKAEPKKEEKVEEPKKEEKVAEPKKTSTKKAEK